MAQSQEQAILQRSLQDKAAEVEVERMSTKVVAEPGRGWVGSGVPHHCPPRALGRGPLSSLPPSQALQLELSRAQEAQRRRQQHTATAEEQLRLVANFVSRYMGWRVGGVAFLLPWFPG